ncbi:GerMN domain-containing protein, partial [Streptomyces sp. CBMA29]|uniref:GerMN domain-containing protein n=1 Tax=Streptomyces sp. CBMA29 TaxID=1896314 RepID=UPI001661DB2B
VSVYFLSDGALRAVPRRAPDGAGPAVALRLLFAGPGDADPTTLTTRLPSLPRPPVVLFDGATTVVRLPAGVDRLSPLAMDQVVCTLAANPGAPPRTAPPAVPGVPATRTPRSASSSPGVRVIGEGWALSRLVESCS